MVPIYIVSYEVAKGHDQRRHILQHEFPSLENKTLKIVQLYVTRMEILYNRRFNNKRTYTINSAIIDRIENFIVVVYIFFFWRFIEFQNTSNVFLYSILKEKKIKNKLFRNVIS